MRYRHPRGSVLILLVAAVVARGQTTALDEFIQEPDPAYSYRLEGRVPGIGYTAHILELTSQQWRSPAEVNRVRWQHWLTVIIPANLTGSTAVLLISGGSHTDGPPSLADQLLLGTVALQTRSVVAEIKGVPNQPLRFADETRNRSEDAIIAYSWNKYLRTGDRKWPVQFAMTKAAVRAMDAITAYCASPEGGAVAVEKFIVTGASKRGWTTWLAAAVDRRVVGIIPMVFDALNMEASFLHHWRAYGFWAPAIRDYEEAGVMAWMGTPQLQTLLAMVDPYTYRDRLRIPKLLINASGDEFFLPDSAQFYFDGLVAPKYVRYMPNANHALSVVEAIPGAIAFAQFLTQATPLPQFSWQYGEEGRITVRTETPAAEARLWQATNPRARDFRVETLGLAWRSSTLTGTGGIYEARVAVPAEGWTAFFVELDFVQGGQNLRLTTPVRVVPDRYPFPQPLAAVSAADYRPLTAPNAIVSAFGDALAGAVIQAGSLPLPQELGGVSVRVSDAEGVERQERLFFVSPGQLNFLISPGTARGLARVDVWRDGRWVTRGATVVEDAAPALFSANGDGRGVAAAVAVRYRPGGSMVTQMAFDTAAPAGARRATPIDLGDAGDSVYLLLFGTGMSGFRGRVEASVGGESVGVAGPVPQGEYAGLDQINLGPLPRTLAGRGEVEIRISFDGRPLNVLLAHIR